MLVSAFSLIFAAVGLAQPASAAPPTVQTVHEEFMDVEIIDCGDFQILASATVDVRETIYFDKDGNEIRLMAHITYIGTLTNSVTGFSVSDPGHHTFFLDFVTGTERTTGLIYQITIPGQGSVVMDVGSITFEADGDVVIHGPHDVFVEGDAALCAALDG